MSIEIIKKYIKEDGSIDLQDEKLQEELNQYEEGKTQELEEKLTSGLKSKNQELLDEVKRYKTNFQETQEKLKSFENKKAEDNGDYKTIAESLRNQLKEAEEQRTRDFEELNKVNSTLKNKTIDGYTKDILIKNGADPDLLDFIINDFKDKADIDIKEDGNFDIKAKLGDDSVDFEDYVKETLKHDRYKRVILAPQDSGGNAPGNGDKSFSIDTKNIDNPWKTGNLTKQIELKESNPTLAEKLQNEVSKG